ncbi:aminotransferase class III-fold pyridoxal phosphate-dependent enzyme [Marinibacterium profundimaris]|uniref:aminotransferase class III-fold pyridoxal phosphate-dependent enzyme n=1 Tax=Marinibacterium profundimaris TaxID=1679460 RepID=UPI000B522DA4|nr:aminotransferase class III-fold pyridoxal phosphate-dependent enzyme [Marinibacterium profundimaris]
MNTELRGEIRQAPVEDVTMGRIAGILAHLLGHAPDGLRNLCLDGAMGPLDGAWVTDEAGRLCLRAAGGALIARGVPGGEAPDWAPALPGGDALPTADFAAWATETGLSPEAAFDPARDTVLGERAACVPLAAGLMPEQMIQAVLAAAFGLSALAEARMEGAVLPRAIGGLWRAGRLPDAPLWAVATAREAHVDGRGWIVDLALVDDAGQGRLWLDHVRFDRAVGGAGMLDPLAIDPEAPGPLRKRILEQLQSHAASLLGRQDMPCDLPLAEMGLDSILVIDLSVEVETRIGVDLPFDRLSHGATLTDLAEIAADTVLQAARATRDGAEEDSLFARHVNPALDQRLALAGVARDYVRGAGHMLHDAQGRAVIDCVAQYGALPFGHNPPRIWEALTRLQAEQVPAFMSLSPPPLAGRLAERLTGLAPEGLDTVFFCTSGAEAIEGAIKLARSATGRPGILSTTGGFHGLTLGAMSATGRSAYHAGFGAPVAGFDHIPYGDLDALEAKLAEAGETIAAFIVEPLQAEGGIVTPPKGYLEGAAAICRRHGVLLVADEVQTGLGRLGALFASAAARPDIVTLAKALGGGLVPMGAVLYRGALLNDAFALRHGSTFGSTALGAAAGLATLEELTRDDHRLLAEVEVKGRKLSAALQAIAGRHPNAVRAVRGRGLLQGLVLATGPSAYASPVLNLLCQWEAFGMVLASYVLNRHGIRVAPALADGAVLRIEPPLDCPESVIDDVAAALEDLADTLERGDARRLMAPLLGIDRAPDPAPARPRPPVPERRADEGRFAFLVHLMGQDDLARFDPGFAGLDLSNFDRARALLTSEMRPAVITEVELGSATGARATGDVILVPHTARELMAMRREAAAEAVGAGVALGVARGADIVGLGGFTSVVTDAGAALTAPVPLTSGNTLTAISAGDGVLDGLARMGRDPARTTVLVIGGFGSVGRGIVMSLADRVGRILVAGRPEPEARALARLDALRAEVASMEGTPPPWSARGRMVAGEAEAIGLSRDMGGDMGRAGAVVAATNALGALVDPAQLQPGAVVSDVSRPFNLPPDLAAQRPDLCVIEGGVIAPQAPFDIVVDFGTPRHCAYACMAETMLLALMKEPGRPAPVPGPQPGAAELRRIAGAARAAGMRTVISPDPDQDRAREL